MEANWGYQYSRLVSVCYKCISYKTHQTLYTWFTFGSVLLWIGSGCFKPYSSRLLHWHESNNATPPIRDGRFWNKLSRPLTQQKVLKLLNIIKVNMIQSCKSHMANTIQRLSFNWGVLRVTLMIICIYVFLIAIFRPFSTRLSILGQLICNKNMLRKDCLL